MSVLTLPRPSEASPVSANRRRDHWSTTIAVAAALLSVAGYWFSWSIGATLLYKDAISHMEIARRVVVSTSESAAQLGSVWLPLPHILMLPFVWIDALYYSGFAGSIVSMAAYVLATVFIYRTARDLTGGLKLAGLTAAAVFALNANMLYMQATPMTESLLFCALAGAVFYLQRWIQRRQYHDMIRSSIWIALAALTRYESWPIFVCLLISVVVVARYQRPTRSEESQPGFTKNWKAFAFGALMAIFMAISIGGWATWGAVIFGSFLSFQNGEYAKPSLWVDNFEPSVGHLGVAIRTYWLAMVDTVGLPVLLLACIGLAVFLYHGFFRARLGFAMLPVLSLLVTVPFFVAALFAGQRPLHVMEISSELYNVRFGLIMLLPAAILSGYLVYASADLGRYLRHVAAAAVIVLTLVTSITSVATANVSTYNEPKIALAQVRTVEQQEVTQFFKENYRGGRVLMESFGNELLAFYAVPSDELVYEGSYLQWGAALKDPSNNGIDWIITYGGSDGPDKVSRQYPEGPPSGFSQAFRAADGNYRVYRRD